jgi:predicted dienelactone hydrolase
MRRAAWTLALIIVTAPVHAQAVYGDARPDAPELAARGPLAVGVRTVTVEHADQLDILYINENATNRRYDRRLTLEFWYPAQAGQPQNTVYRDVLGAGPGNPARPNTPFEFAGRAARDGVRAAGTYPLVIVSHGYPGSRLQMSYLTENLASKGYVVVAIDHAESTRLDKAGFASTLLHRRLDDLFVLDTVAAWSRPGSGHFLAGLVDAGRTALIGYSMGEYGALNAAGAGISAAAVAMGPAAALAVNQDVTPDARIKAVVAFAPWGGAHRIWDADSLARVRVPVLFIAGDQDDVAGYRDGVLPLFESLVHAPRYLLTYEGARHNVAPNPPPPAAWANVEDFMAYAEPVWDSRRINNINQHFVTAFLGVQLQGLPLQAYLDLASLAPSGTVQPETNVWKGFRKRTALGLAWRRLEAR